MSKKSFLVLFSILLLSVSSVFAAEAFVIREELYTKITSKTYYLYFIDDAPAEYKEYIGNTVYYDSSVKKTDGLFANLFYVPSYELVCEALKNDNFNVYNSEYDNILCIYDKSKWMDFSEQKEFIFETLKSKYAGYSDMKKRGFSEALIEDCKDFEDIKNIFKTYMDDYHFYLAINGFPIYKQTQVFDEGSVRSTEPEDLCYIRKTSNTYYVRATSCYNSNKRYNELPELAKEAKNKDYIVMDFRSNNGGNNIQQLKFFKNLVKAKYKGTIYLLQDNWSYSSGEIWETASEYKNKLNFILMGTHSGGMQYYGNCKTFSKNEISLYTPTKSFVSYIPSNYLGEGKGYEPQIWCDTKDLYNTLSGYGLDLTEIEFK